MDINFEIDDKTSDEVLQYILENCGKELIAFKALLTAFKLCDDLGLDDEYETRGSDGYMYNLLCLLEGKLQDYIGKGVSSNDSREDQDAYAIIFEQILHIVDELNDLDVLEYLCGKIRRQKKKVRRENKRTK